jgi:hypothetical protein
MPHPDCIVPGCRRSGATNLGVRLRNPDATAVWAFETTAHLCDKHARSGGRLSLVYEPTSSGRIEFSVQGATAPVTHRTPAIR